MVIIDDTDKPPTVPIYALVESVRWGGAREDPPAGECPPDDAPEGDPRRHAWGREFDVLGMGVYGRWVCRRCGIGDKERDSISKDAEHYEDCRGIGEVGATIYLVLITIVLAVVLFLILLSATKGGNWP